MRGRGRGRPREGQCGSLRFLILSHALTHGGRTYGYGILKEIVELSDGEWRPSVGTIYKVISELVSEGLLRECGSEIRRGRQIQYYEITDEGIKELIRYSYVILRRISTGMKFLLRLYRELIRTGKDKRLALKVREELREILREFKELVGDTY